ncbi:ATP-binding cassette domain-containing protein [Paracoccus sp. DMF-8]|uniref:ATP-binding cassette domain-containing protein n=1 Tax=Paracoccus sp. DMF-8 TaxID=3019445 RepID=UPI0023E3D843|nr:ATP-binding cassette domain-containing protein [Paracoccus sp. DMF-8]MDF3607619.1 ATP-binding cassette domain-containing protein [Paracoccus sp. DMF-8]
MLTTNRPAFLRAGTTLSARIDAMLDRVGLTGKAGRRMGALSGGERQRVLLAQALIDDKGREPDLLVLDEPMAALDAAGAAIFERIISDLHQRGATVIWVEHDLAAVRRIAGRVTAIDGGILFQGAPEQELTPERILSLFSHRRGQAAPDQTTPRDQTPKGTTA